MAKRAMEAAFQKMVEAAAARGGAAAAERARRDAPAWLDAWWDEHQTTFQPQCPVCSAEVHVALEYITGSGERPWFDERGNVVLLKRNALGGAGDLPQWPTFFVITEPAFIGSDGQRCVRVKPLKPAQPRAPEEWPVAELEQIDEMLYSVYREYERTPVEHRSRMREAIVYAVATQHERTRGRESVGQLWDRLVPTAKGALEVMLRGVVQGVLVDLTRGEAASQPSSG